MPTFQFPSQIGSIPGKFSVKSNSEQVIDSLSNVNYNLCVCLEKKDHQ